MQPARSAETLAVLELRTPGVQIELAQVWSDAVRGVAKERLPGLRVYTRENLTTMLKPWPLGGLVDCEDLCEIEIGRKIGAKYIVSGQVISVEGSYIASIKLHETQGGELLGVQEAQTVYLRDMSVALQAATGDLVKPLREALDLPEYVESPRYGAGPVLRSAVVPGWGQVHVGEKRKGTMFLLGEILAGGAAVGLYEMSDYYHDRALNATHPEAIDDYNRWSKQCGTGATLSAITAGLLYVWNLADAVSSSGEIHYSTTDTRPLKVVALLDGAAFQINLASLAYDD